MVWIIVGIVVVALIIGLVLASNSVFVVEQQKYGIVERFGKFERVASPGLNFKHPLFEKVSGHISMRLQELDVKVDTKTKDNVFVQLNIAIQYVVLSGANVYDAFYKLTNVGQQMESYVFDVVRATVPGMTLDDVFENKEAIATDIKDRLEDQMKEYGYTIAKALVNDISPAQVVVDSMNQINAAQRLKEAAQYEGEANRIKVVKAAEADAEAKRLSGEGIANQRKAIIAGYQESVENMAKATGATAENVMTMVMMSQYFDALREMAAAGNSVIFTQSTPGAIKDIQQQMLEAMAASQLVGTVPVTDGAGG